MFTTLENKEREDIYVISSVQIVSETLNFFRNVHTCSHEYDTIYARFPPFLSALIKMQIHAALTEKAISCSSMENKSFIIIL